MTKSLIYNLPDAPQAMPGEAKSMIDSLPDAPAKRVPTGGMVAKSMIDSLPDAPKGAENIDGMTFYSGTSVPENAAVRAALTYKGTKYVWGGNSAQGIDCSGLTRNAYKSTGVNLPRTAQEQAKATTLVGKDQAQPGDLVFFNTKRGKNTHVGIYVGNGKFVHASTGKSQRVVVDDLGNSWNKTHFAGFRRVGGGAAAPEVEDSSLKPKSRTYIAKQIQANKNLGKPARLVAPYVRTLLKQAGVPADEVEGKTIILMNEFYHQLTPNMVKARQGGEAIEKANPRRFMEMPTAAEIREVVAKSPVVKGLQAVGEAGLGLVSYGSQALHTGAGQDIFATKTGQAIDKWAVRMAKHVSPEFAQSLEDSQFGLTPDETLALAGTIMSGGGTRIVTKAAENAAYMAGGTLSKAAARIATVGQAINEVKGAKGVIARLPSSMLHGAAGMVEFTTLIKTPSFIDNPQKATEEWLQELPSAVQGGLLLGLATHGVGELSRYKADAKAKRGMEMGQAFNRVADTIAREKLAEKSPEGIPSQVEPLRNPEQLPVAEPVDARIKGVAPETAAEPLTVPAPTEAARQPVAVKATTEPFVAEKPISRASGEGLKEPLVKETAAPSVEVKPAIAKNVKPATDLGGDTHAYTGSTPAARAATAATKRTDIVSASKIVKELEAITAPIRVGGFRAGKEVRGIFKSFSEVIRTRKANDIPTITHEIGHSLQKTLFPESVKRGNITAAAFPKEYAGELSKMAYPGAKDQVVEGYAEYMRLYMTDPVRAAEQAPKFDAFFKERIAQNPIIEKAVTKARDDIARWVEQGAEARVESTIVWDKSTDKRPPAEKMRERWDNFYKNWVNENQPIYNIEKAITKGRKVESSKSPSKEAWIRQGAAGKVETWIHYGVTDSSGNKIAPSLQETLKPVLESEIEYRKWGNYVVAKHGLEVIKELGPDSMPLSAADYKRTVDAAPAHYEKLHRDFQKWMDAGIDEMQNSGVLSAEQVKAMREKWPDYVPLQRDMGDAGAKATGSGKGVKNLRTGINRLKGSGRDILPPVESAIRNMFLHLDVASKNRVWLKMADLASSFEGSGIWMEKVPAPIKGAKVDLKQLIGAEGIDALAEVGIDIAKPETIFTPADIPGGKNMIRVFRDGKPEYYELHPELYEVAAQLDAKQLDIYTKLLSLPARLLRAGATGLSPDFPPRNIFKDAQEALVYTKYGITPFDIARGLFHAAKQDELFWKWRAAGGAHASMVSIDRDLAKRTVEQVRVLSTKQKIVDAAKHPLDALRAFGEAVEYAPRLAEFGKGTKWGRKADPNTLIEAAIASRDLTIDFQRSGSTGKTVNRSIAFFNAALQGSDKLLREAKNNPETLVMRGLGYITVPTVMLYLKNRKQEWYQDLPDYVKDNNWLIKVGGTIYRFPRAFGLGFIFGTAPERAMRYILGKDEHAFDELEDRAGDAFLPGFVPTFAMPLIQSLSNRSFTGAPIVPRREQDLPAQLQSGPDTSEFARAGGKLLKQSPRKIDYVIYGYTGGAGKTIVNLADGIIERAGKSTKPPRPAKTAAEWPVVRGFTVSPYTASAWTDRLYKERQKLKDKFKLADEEAGRPLTDKQRYRLDELDGYAKALSVNGKISRAVDVAMNQEELSELCEAADLVLPRGNINQQKRILLIELKKEANTIARSAYTN